MTLGGTGIGRAGQQAAFICELPAETRLGWARAGWDPILLATLSHDADDLIVERVAGNDHAPADLLTKLWNEHPSQTVRARVGQSLYGRQRGALSAAGAYAARHPDACGDPRFSRN